MAFIFLFILFFNNIFSYRVSVITSVYKGGDFVKKYINNIQKQSIFHECEFIIIDANSDENEYLYFENLKDQFRNIKFIRLNHTPTLYECWNIGISLSSSDLITNWNIDDLRMYDNLELMANFLENNSNISLVYGDCLVSFEQNASIKKYLFKLSNLDKRFHDAKVVDSIDKITIWFSKQFTTQNMLSNPPGPMPMWRKSIHDKYGFFDSKFKSAGDWEMWCRAAELGAIYYKMNIICGIYYFNPKGLSTIDIFDQSKISIKKGEEDFVFEKYKKVFKW